MEVIKFLINIKELANHTYAEDIYSAEFVGKSVIVGRILSISNTVLKSAPLKCVGIMEEPPLNRSRKTKHLVNIFLRNDFASADLEIGSLIAVNPGDVSKSSEQILQACLGFDERNPGQMWVEGSSRFTEKSNTCSQQNVHAVDCLKEDCFCSIWKWFATPLSNDKTGSKALKDVECVGVSSFNIVCKVLMVQHERKNCSVLRVTDGTLGTWPLVFLDRFRFSEIGLMNHKKYFIDILMKETGDSFQRVKENMLIKLYGVEVKKFEATSGVYHCFRASGDPARFKILPQTHTMKLQIDKALRTFMKCERTRKLEIDSWAANRCSSFNLPKSDAATPDRVSSSSGSTHISGTKIYSDLNKSSSCSEELVVDPTPVSTPRRNFGSNRALQSTSAVTCARISGTESKGCVTKIPNFESRPPVKIRTATQTHHMENQKEKALNTSKGYKRPQRVEIDRWGANRCKLPKLGHSIRDSDFIDSDNMSRKKACSDLNENSSPMVETPLLLTANNSCASKPPLQSGRVATHVQNSDVESKGITCGVKVPKSIAVTPTKDRSSRVSTDIRGRKISSDLNDSSSSSEEFLVDPPLVSSPRRSCGGDRPLQSASAVTCARISGTESKASTGVTKVLSFEGRSPVKTVPQTHHMESQTYKALNTSKGYKRPQRVEIDRCGANRRKLLKLGVSIQDTDFIDPDNVSRRKACSELDEGSSSTVDPPANNSCASKQPLQSGRLVRSVQNSVTESSGVEVPKSDAATPARDRSCSECTDVSGAKIVSDLNESSSSLEFSVDYPPVSIPMRCCGSASTMSRKKACSELNETNLSVVEPSLLLIDDNSCTSKRPLQSGSVVARVKNSDTESKGFASGVEVLNFECGCITSYRKQTSQVAEQPSEDSDELNADLDSSVESDDCLGCEVSHEKCENSSCDMANVYSLEISQLPSDSECDSS